jgi:hypothetical protein
VGALPAALLIAASSGTAIVSAGATGASASVVLNQIWSVPVNDSATGLIAMSSPSVATLDGGGPAVVVGDRTGYLYALHLSNGSEVAGWPAYDGGIPIDSAPSSAGATVFVGEGNASNLHQGGYAAFAANGRQAWLRAPSYTGGAQTVGVDSGLAVGNLEGQTDVVGGSMGEYSEALSAGGTVLGGWPFLAADSNFATPAIADLYSNGHQEVIEGGDSTGNPVVKDQLGRTYTSGGHVRVLSGNGQLLCEYNTNQVVQSSAAVGEFLGGTQVGITVGTGTWYAGASQTNQLLGLDSHCNLRWATTLDGATTASPALVNALGGGAVEIAEGTNVGGANQNGSVYLVNGSTGHVLWRTPALGAILGGVVSFPAGGHEDIVAATTQGAEIFDGRNGAVLWSGLHGVLAFQNAPLVTRDANGTVGITFAGYSGSGSRVAHFEVAGSNGSTVGRAGSWPSFHRNAQLTGDAGTPPPVVAVPCHAPSSTPSGYYLVASDGGIFTYGNLPFCGSTGAILLNKPIIGMAATHNAGGYWLVASDGGIFSFGNASFHGSTGGMHLNRPIVAMAATPDGRGYWLVASDGGIFAFGDAGFHGSTGAIHLNRPIVAMAATPDGRGYWLVASDGGIFAFGDAGFHGSTGGMHLNRPIVGMAASPTGGYWLVATDGGMFAFDAAYHGSTGGIHLNKPIVDMAAPRGGNGYWLAGTDGGMFSFHALYYGSTGAMHLNRPIVGMTGF